VLDLEEMDESVSLTDFTLDDFRIELLNYLENNRAKLIQAPLGLYAVVPAPAGEHAEASSKHQFTQSEKDIIKPGTIFCLRQKGESDGNEQVNPLNPYFLVYVRNDGTVRYNYINAKQILEVFRLLCQGSTLAYEKICSLFNSETANGQNMEQYTLLLKKAVEEVIRIFKKRTAQKLTADRGAIIQPRNKQIEELSHFELITWLIIK